MPNQCEAIIEAFQALGGERTIREIEDWVKNKYGASWKSLSTAMADMVPLSLGGNPSSQVQDRLRVLERVGKGIYRLAEQTHNIAERVLPKVPTYKKTPSQGEVVSYEINGAKSILGDEFDRILQIIKSANITHDGIMQAFKVAGWQTEVRILGNYKTDVYKDGIIIEIESVDKSSVIDVLHRDLFRFSILKKMGKLKIAILITSISGGEVNLVKVQNDMNLYGKHYEVPLLAFGV
ncbi:MAG: hypothetical protein QME64_02725 [bacterium]|nr:hypothetical protein [bacterium]